jgi:hypothetical protein
MHDEEGPRRLRQGADTPETLLRALTALRNGVDDSARLQRVGQKMEAVLASQPSAAQLPARRFFGQKPGVLKLIAAGLGLGLLAPLFFFQHMDDVSSVPSSDREGSPVPSAAPQNSEKVEPTQVARIEQPVALEVAAPEQPAATTITKRTPRTVRPRRQRERSAAEAQTVDSESELEAKNDQDNAPVARPSAEPPAPPVAAAARPQPKPAVTEEAPRVSEAELLLKARQALKRDPELALRLASEHQAQYANGRLTPEREVLAIEALRNLGRKQEADERLHKFEARYPSSIHLERLRESR